MLSKFRYALRAGLLCASVQAEQLTLKRLHQEPSLSGPSLRQAEFSPDSQRVTYLKGAIDDAARLDLWQYLPATGESSLLVDSASLTGGEQQFSAEEQARRERQRVSSTGITRYSWHPDGQSLMFPLADKLWLFTPDAPESSRLRQLADGNNATDVRFSSLGRFVSFVRDQNIFAVDVASGRVRQLTLDGGGDVSFGMAEFVAQEEMDRDTGYWWAPNDQFLAFAKVDESPIPMAQRYEQGKDGLTIVSQRYPFAGSNNASVQIGVMDMLDGHVTWLDLGSEKDIYVARVNWLPDSRHITVQRQSRDQQTLDLLVFDILTGKPVPLLRETSSTWVNLHSDLRFISNGQQFIWASEKSGFKHLYLHDRDGKLVKPLTQGEWAVEELKVIDEVKQEIFFTAYKDSPLELHLYAVSLKDGQIRKLTTETGWHNVTVSEDGEYFLDLFSSPAQPPQLKLHDRSGNRLTYLLENAIDDSHPYAPYVLHDIQPTFGEIKSEDGQALFYRMYQPAALEEGKKYPVIIDVYGGPHGARVNKAWDSRNGFWHKLMAQRGFVVFSLDNRGTNRRGVKFEAPIYQKMGVPEVVDQQAGVAFLRTLPFVDGERIGVFGWSYGGYMTLMSMMKAPQDFKVGVSVAPVTDWLLYDTHYTERYMGLPARNAEGYKNSNVLSHVDGLQGKLLLVHGMADDNVLFLHAAKLIDALQRKNKPFDLMLYPGSKHGIRGDDLRLHLFSLITGYFEQHLAAPTNAVVNESVAEALPQ